MCQDFSHFLRFFASFCIGQISHQQHKGKELLLQNKAKHAVEADCAQAYYDVLFFAVVHKGNFIRHRGYSIMKH